MTADSNKKQGMNDNINNNVKHVDINSRGNRTNTVKINKGEEPDIVQDGDIAAIQYSLYTEDNELICSNVLSKKEINKKYIGICSDNNNLYETLWVAAGKPDILPGLHSSIIGMNIGQSKKVVISPEEAYGNRMDDKIMKLSSIKKIPRFVSITDNQFSQEFHKKPLLGATVKLVPYFNHRVTEISENQVTLEADIKEASSVSEKFGRAELRPEDNFIIISLNPEIGAEFIMNHRKGYITSKNENQFTVDFNHILAGEKLNLEVKVISIKKLSKVLDQKIDWFENYDEGLNVSIEKEKPSVVVLYSNQCGWCKKLLTETMNDPRVTKFNDDFIWVKASEEMYPELMNTYELKSFPAIIFIGSHGEEIKKISGFRYAPVLRDELSTFLDKMKKAPVYTSVVKGSIKPN